MTSVDRRRRRDGTDESAAHVENMLLLRKEDFDTLVDLAAERGAKRALSAIGLDGDTAAADVRDMRGLLEAFKQAKQTAASTVVKLVTTGIVMAILAGVAIKLKLFGDGH